MTDVYIAVLHYDAYDHEVTVAVSEEARRQDLLETLRTSLDEEGDAVPLDVSLEGIVELFNTALGWKVVLSESVLIGEMP